MATVRKFKMKANGKKSVTKSKIIFIGETSDFEPIFMTAETKSVLDDNYNKALAELYKTAKLPTREKTINELNSTEKELYNIRDEEFKKTKMLVVYDETNPEFISKKSEIETLKTLILLASYFKMDALVETEDGKEITHWEDWGLNPKIGLLGLAKFLADKVNGLGLSDAEIGYITEEIDRMKKGQQTWGELILQNIQSKEELKADAMKEFNKTMEKLKEEGLVEDDEEDEGDSI